MRGKPLAAAIGATCWCAAAASQAVVDDAQVNADFSPVLRIEPPHDQQAVYGHAELMCEMFGDCPPAARGIASQKPAPPPAKGMTFQLRLPQAPPQMPVYSTLVSPKISDAVAQFDPILIEGERLSRWYGDLSLSRIERILPCLGCKGAPKPLPAALDFGVDLLFATLRGLFQQPRERGEPNDEALYLAHDGCADDGNIRCGTRPQLP